MICINLENETPYKRQLFDISNSFHNCILITYNIHTQKTPILEAQNKMKSFSIVIMFVLISQYQISGAKITLEQMEQAAAPVRMACIGKTKVSEDLLAAMRKGTFDDSKELKCYINCVMEMMQTVSLRKKERKKYLKVFILILMFVLILGETW